MYFIEQLNEEDICEYRLHALWFEYKYFLI